MRGTHVSTPRPMTLLSRPAPCVRRRRRIAARPVRLLYRSQQHHCTMTSSVASRPAAASSGGLERKGWADCEAHVSGSANLLVHIVLGGLGLLLLLTRALRLLGHRARSRCGRLRGRGVCLPAALSASTSLDCAEVPRTQTPSRVHRHRATQRLHPNPVRGAGAVSRDDSQHQRASARHVHAPDCR